MFEILAPLFAGCGVALLMVSFSVDETYNSELIFLQGSTLIVVGLLCKIVDLLNSILLKLG